MFVFNKIGDKYYLLLVEGIDLKPGDKRQRREICHILEKFIKVIYPGESNY